MESLDRIESGKLSQTLGATTPKALAPAAVLARRSQSLLIQCHKQFLVNDIHVKRFY